MSEPACINLAERFGRDHRITFDEAYDPQNRPRATLDPWCMEIPGRFGTIYPAGGNILAVMIDGHPKLANELRRLPCCKVLQDGDGESTFLFDVTHFPDIAAIVLPRRRRRASIAEWLRLAALSAHGFGVASLR